MALEVSGTRSATPQGMSRSRLVVFYCASVIEGRWPLVVGPERLIPASRTVDDGGRTVHLHRRSAPAVSAPGVPAVTFCGRHVLSLGVKVEFEVLGVDRDRLCHSCWRIAEDRLEPPGAADGEDHVVAWLVETVLKGGSATIDDVPFGRVRPLRQRVTRQVKATIGGTVTTAFISLTTIMVYSALVIDAKTPRPATPGTARCNAAPLDRRMRSSTRPTGLAATLVANRHGTGPIA
jgi:hypothetical protein